MSTISADATAGSSSEPDKILITNEDVFKKFVVEEIKAIADPDSADSDVLADYVFALVQSEKSLENLRGNFMENLDDFLGENTGKFAEKLLNALATGSYDQSHVQKQTQQTTEAHSAPAETAAVIGAGNGQSGPGPRQSIPAGPRAMMRDNLKPPSGPSSMGYNNNSNINNNNGNGHAGGNQFNNRGFRKRERERSVSVDPENGPRQSDDRSFKHTRRGDFNGSFRGRGNWNGQQGHRHGQQLHQMQQPQQPQQFGFDGNNQGMMFQNPGFQAPMNGQQMQFDPSMMQAAMVGMGMEGFPQNLQALLGGLAQTMQKASEGGWNNSGRGRGRGRGGMFGGRGGRAEFSSTAPNQDRSITTVVVENIPAENLNEESVRNFFSEFGTIEELNLQPHRRLALVKYDSYESANKAYSSPRTIFDNRFVKVYWHKPDQFKKNEEEAASTTSPVEEGPSIDSNEIERRQQAFQERQVRLQEAEKQRKEVEAKRKEQEEQRKQLLELLNKVQASKTEAASSGEAGPVDETDALRAKLQELEKEAQQMGIEGTTAAAGRGGYPGYRGAYRGRFATRGRGRGRGGWYQSMPVHPSVRKIDNRPKRVSVNVAAGSSADEALRQFLFSNFNFDSVDPHPDQGGLQIVSFSERYLAENFMKAAISEIPNVGVVDAAWVPNTVATPAPKTVNPAAAEFVPSGAPSGNENAAPYPMVIDEQDYDVADDTAMA